MGRESIESMRPAPVVLALAHFDWILILAILPLYLFGILTMSSYTSDNLFFDRQLAWVVIGLALMFAVSFVDMRFLRRQSVIVGLFLATLTILGTLFLLGSAFKGAQSWFSLGALVIQPSDPAKLVLVLLLAKYFSRRHIEIANIRHILVSGVYTFFLIFLVILQPDFGSAVILAAIWFGMVLVSGLSKKHLALVALTSAVVFGGLWSFGFEDYQKQRVLTFLHPLADIRGAGYNAYQSTVAVGSGEILGKGIGYGTQSKLQFLPEYETDFIFAAFAEEWGFVGSLLVLLLFGVIIWRILRISMGAETNFESLYGLGLVSLILAQAGIHIGMNIGLLPVTGVTLPFISYGGSHIVTEAFAIGVLMSMRRTSPGAHREDFRKEFVGI